MKTPAGNGERHERAIGALLRYGTWLASAVIAIGMALGAFPQFNASIPFGFSGYGIVKAGVALFILLPVARVVLMLAIFLRERDYVYMAISALVLAIIVAGVMFGL
ncbi:MAG: DUF1634 domain-containing protein [Noviherbaspirillum sp.]